jgi:hypothetical protein
LPEEAARLSILWKAMFERHYILCVNEDVQRLDNFFVHLLVQWHHQINQRPVG